MTTPEVIEDPSTVSREWDELADRAKAPPWLRPGWVLAWQRAFAPGPERLELVCVRAGGTMVAALPLLRSGATLATPANSETPFFGVLAEEPADLATLAAHLFERNDRRVTVWPFEPGEGIDALLFAAAKQGYSSTSRTIGRSPFIPLESGWDDYRKSLGSKLMSEARRRRRHLESKGALTLEVDDGKEDMPARLAAGLRVEAAGWKGRRGTAIASRGAARAFYEEVCEWAAQRGMLRLAFLLFDGRPIAFDLCFEEGGIHYLLKTSYDQEFSSFGPGVLMRREMIERAFATGLRRYEFLGHDEPWKHRWASHFREQLLVRCFAPTARGAAERFLYARVRPAARRALDRVRRDTGD